MGFGDSAKLLLTIKADSSQAQRELKEIKGEVGGLGGALGGLGNPAAIGAAAIAAVGAAAVTASVALFKLVAASSEYGSALYDATVQTGLSAEAISTLKLAADSSGSSLESAAGSVAKLNVLVGQAANGNEKAQKTLAQYGITAKDTNEAFNQAVKVIGAMTDQGQKAAAMQGLFKDRTGQLGGIIDQVNGDFEAYIATARKLGVVLSREDLQASDDFGDSLGVLGTQAKIAGVKFSTELMPMLTGAMSEISRYMAANQGVARAWGKELVTIAQGVGVAYRGLGKLFDGVLDAMTLGMLDSAKKSVVWAAAWEASINLVSAGLYGLFKRLGQTFGSPIPDIAGQVPVDSVPSSIPGASSTDIPQAGKTPSKTTKVKSYTQEDFDRDREIERKKAVAAAMAEMRDTLAIYSAGYAERLALLDYNLSQKLTSELNYIRDVGRIHLEALNDEIRLNKELLETGKLNAEERINVQNKIKVLEIEIRTEKLKTASAITRQINEEEEERQKNHEKELRRIQDISDAHQQAFHKRRMAAKELAAQERDDRISSVGLGGGFAQGIGSAISIMADSTISAAEKIRIALAGIKESWLSMKAGVMGAINEFVGGLASMLETWILMGSAGPDAMRKLTASILAGLAAQAAVHAIFELAKGFAALFWNPAEAAAHFKAAALFGLIAAGAAGAGRAAAGNAFNQQASTATGSSGNSPDTRTNFGGQFQGFGGSSPIAQALERLTLVTAQSEETNHRLARTIQGVGPTELVRLAADAEPEIFGRATGRYLEDSGAGGTDKYHRAFGYSK